MGEKQTVDFAIQGRMTPDGRVKLSATAQKTLALNNDGKIQQIGAWNVFGPKEQPVKQVGHVLVIEASDAFPQLNMQLAWSAKKVDCAALGREIEFVEKKYEPFVETAIDAYKEASTDANLWKRLDVDQAQDWVLAKIKKKYPDAGVGAQTKRGPDGSWQTTVFPGEEPYPFIDEWRADHEKYHLDNHKPKDDEMYKKPYEQYVQWVMANEVETWTSVNRAKAKRRDDELKAEKQKYCAGK